jgi:hypothetical protein
VCVFARISGTRSDGRPGSIAAENQLTGPIPRNLTTITTLQTINLFRNQLSGGVPENIGNLRALQVKHVQNPATCSSSSSSSSSFPSTAYIIL